MKSAFSNSINASKVFLTRKSEVSNRWDPFYYRPDLVTLEEKVRRVTSLRLRDFVIRMAGGATPSTKETDTHYTDDANGIPFIRVQNLSTTGKLNLEDYRRITRSTHEGLLARSRLTGGELLVKITGVGRMAVASVVPEGFEGNINQHIVAIRTTNIKTSEALAAYLNLDIAEKLASRRSTGGTRPALDYPALLSIPVIFDERIPKLITEAVKEYEERRGKAKAMLAQIDDVLLSELGIEPRELKPLQSQIFRKSFSEITGTRFDAHYHRPEFLQLESVLLQHEHALLRELVMLSHELWDQRSLFKDEFPYVEIGVIDLALGRITSPQSIPVPEAPSRARMVIRPGDLLVSLTRPTRRAIALVDDDIPIAVASNGFAVVRQLDESKIVKRYLYHVLRSRLCVPQFDQRSSGGSYPAITEDQFLKLLIPLPEPKRQAHIAAILDKQYQQAEALLIAADEELQRTKQNIEELLIGEGGAA
jgi:hypothetical protein